MEEVTAEELTLDEKVKAIGDMVACMHKETHVIMTYTFWTLAILGGYVVYSALRNGANAKGTD